MNLLEKNFHLDNVFKELTTSLARFNGILFQSDSTFKAYYKDRMSWLQDEVDAFPMLSSNFFYNNPFEPGIVIGGEYDVLKSDFKESILFMRRKVHNYYVAQAFECFETFLKSTLSIYLYYHFEAKSEIVKSLKVSARSLSEIRTRVGRLNSYERFKLSRRSFAQEYYSETENYESHLQFIYIIEQIRHSITHRSDEHTIKEEDLENRHRVDILNQILFTWAKGPITLDLSKYSGSKSVLEEFAVIAHILNHYSKC